MSFPDDIIYPVRFSLIESCQLLSGLLTRIFIRLLGGRLMVGQQVLALLIGVRIPASQPASFCEISSRSVNGGPGRCQIRISKAKDVDILLPAFLPNSLSSFSG